jgi:hypothetical protein
MECEKVRDRFSSLWEKELTPIEKKTVEEHLSSCPACQREFEQFEKTMQWLHSAGEVEVPDKFLSELHKKIEERKRIPPDKTTTGRWFNLPLSLKLPVQAVAMVAVVFLVLYLTKMMPMDGYRPKETRETSSPLSLKEKKPEQVLTRSATPSPTSEVGVEKRRSGSTLSKPWPSEQGVGALAKKEMERERVALKTPSEAPRPKDLEQTKAPVPKEGQLKEASVPQEKAEAKKREASAQSTEVLRYPAVESKEAASVKVPSSEPGKLKRELAVQEKPLVALKPHQEIVLRISDREKAIAQLHKLVRQFGGEIVTTEGDAIIASLPRGSFSELEKELVALSASPEAGKVVPKEHITGSLGAVQGGKKEKVDEKGKELVKPANGEGSRMIVRILLVQE